MNAATPETTAPTRRLTALDSIRGIASFSVLLCHYRLALPQETSASLVSFIWPPLLNLFTNGDAAVILFFVLSGYVLSLPFFRGTQPSYARYVFKRVCRIYIPFAVVVFVAALFSCIPAVREPLAGVGNWLNEQMGSVGSSALAGHFLMIGTQPDIALDSPLWTLIYEMRVSLIFPLLIILCRDTRLALPVAAIMLVASTRLLVALGSVAPWKVDTFWITILWTVRMIPYFMFGILLSKHSDEVRKFTQRVPVPIRIALLVVPIVTFTIEHRGYLSIRRDTLYDISAAMVVVLALDTPQITAMLNRVVLQWLGRISYSVYLIHTPVVVLVFHALIGRTTLWSIVLAATGVTLATATLTYRFVEMPAIRLGQRAARPRPIIAAAESG
jgi:peptidoglycan/LPS O-acetylase OafA/YrhL